MFNKLLIIIISIHLAGCFNLKSDDKPKKNLEFYKRLDSNALDPSKAVLVGAISEGYLTRPHGLQVTITSNLADGGYGYVEMKTKGLEDDFSKGNILGNRFAFEVPPGEYKVNYWSYYHYRGFSYTLKDFPPMKFTVRAGEIAYVGNFHGVALTFCLSNTNKYDDEVNKIKEKFPIIKSSTITNKTKGISFHSWGHTKSESILGKKPCREPVLVK